LPPRNSSLCALRVTAVIFLLSYFPIQNVGYSAADPLWAWLILVIQNIDAMKPSKLTVITYWAATIFIFLFEGVMPALFSQGELAKEGIRHLGYPDYFGVALVVFKVAGSILLIIPRLPRRVKEWVYAGFAFDFIFAAISHGVVDGLDFQTFMPLIILAILVVSYVGYNRIYAAKDR
jgi:uncharacterized membrane protein YphA (DoxX/SURF4 family)